MRRPIIRFAAINLVIAAALWTIAAVVNPWPISPDTPGLVLHDFIQDALQTVAIGLCFGVFFAFGIEVTRSGPVRETVAKQTFCPGRRQFVELIASRGIALAAAAALFAPVVEQSLVARGAVPKSGSQAEVILTALAGMVGVGVGAVTWYVDSTISIKHDG